MAEQNKKQVIEEDNEVIVRILGQDVLGSKNVFTGLTRIKGISWGISNLICTKLKLDKKTKISELNKEQIKNVELALKKLDAPDYLKNRRKDIDTGDDNHLVGVDLEMRRDFDIKRLKQIKSYRGMRHSLKLPVRGQKTRSHFRKSGIAVGVKKPKLGKKS